MLRKSSKAHARGQGGEAAESARLCRAVDAWHELQEGYGEFIAQAALKECGGDLHAAVAMLMVGEGGGKQLGG